MRFSKLARALLALQLQALPPCQAALLPQLGFGVRDALAQLMRAHREPLARCGVALQRAWQSLRHSHLTAFPT
jgi:hypothetical protein